MRCGGREVLDVRFCEGGKLGKKEEKERKGLDGVRGGVGAMRVD